MYLFLSITKDQWEDKDLVGTKNLYIENKKKSLVKKKEHTLKKETTYKKFTYHPSYNHNFQKLFKEFNVTLTVQNKCNNKT